MRRPLVLSLLLLSLSLAAAGVSVAAGLPAVVHKATATVYAAPAFSAAKVATLKKDAPVSVAAQEGLWYRLEPDAAGAAGFVRVNEVRLAASGVKESDTMQVLLTAKSGRGRVSETAGVRGIEESELRSAGHDGAQLQAMQGNRVPRADAAAWAGDHGLEATTIAWPGEARPSQYEAAVAAAPAQAPKRRASSGLGGFAKGLLGSIGGGMVGSAIDTAEKVVPKSASPFKTALTTCGWPPASTVSPGSMPISFMNTNGAR